MSSHACSPEDVQHQQVTQSSILLRLQEATKPSPADSESWSSGPSHLQVERLRGECGVFLLRRLMMCRPLLSEEIQRWRRSRSSWTQRSSSEEESDRCGVSQSKMCVSCRTRKTPLWRDAEDGTPLCNACGIRYKKYRVRCQRCWNIPKKDTNTHSSRQRCGEVLKLKRSSC
ncbi:GATA transcription factor 14-like [Carassius auratus]|uniref:GATA transcription factor 14-like n=1 Tax=Carassius auratus TaxID=7957 RepID=A0A6P6PM09_CARAU|nr:GATA transcription factor 14-like [Carassius auratus]